MAGSSRKVIIAALVGNCLIALTKFAAAAITRSSAMLSESIHSLVDTGNQVLLLYGLRQGRRPADAAYPFGYGRELYFWSFVVAILIFSVGAGISIYEGFRHLLHPAPIGNLFVNYVVLALAMVFEGAAWLYALRAFKRSKGNRGYFRAVHEGKDPTMFIVLFEDSAAMLGLLVALAGIILSDVTGRQEFDGLASILIGIILGVTAAWLAYETKSLLIGESAESRIVSHLRQLATAHPEVEHVNKVLTMHMGPEDILVNISVDFVNGINADQVEKVIAAINREFQQAVPSVSQVFVEAEARLQRAGGPA